MQIEKLKKYLIYSFWSICTIFIIQEASASPLFVPKITKEVNISHVLVGEWDIQTIVTKSSCPYIFVGTTTKSQLEIKFAPLKTKKGILKAFWKGGKWKESKGVIELLNNSEAITHRVTELKTSDKNKWKAILIDHLHLDGNNTMYLDSIVIQYRNGTAVGEYKTHSILTKNK